MTPSSSTGNEAQVGNFLFTLHTKTSNPWIIDSRASNHVTCSSNIFFSYTPRLGCQNVKILDGSHSFVAGNIDI